VGRKFALFKRLTAPIGFEKGRKKAKFVLYIDPLNGRGSCWRSQQSESNQLKERYLKFCDES